ncbi:MAG TPA: hypothetical protein VGX02_00415, partial [Candidatus Eremiobacteraceae bacterium]|nr:hypothetical protein [Candidatus Eremiobacteraceae bacterium]
MGWLLRREWPTLRRPSSEHLCRRLVVLKIVHISFTVLSQPCPQGKLVNPRNVSAGLRSGRRSVRAVGSGRIHSAGIGDLQIKGTKSGLLLHLHERPLSGAVVQLRERLESQPGFYKGSRAVLLLGSQPAEGAELAAIIATLEQFGIVADGAVCDADDVAALARSAGLRLVGASIAAAPRSRDDRIAPRDDRPTRKARN